MTAHIIDFTAEKVMREIEVICDLIIKQSRVPDRHTARALVEANYMPISDYLRLYGEDGQ